MTLPCVFGRGRTRYPRNVDFDVQDPPGTQAADGEEMRRLRAIFRRPRTAAESADGAEVPAGGADVPAGGADVPAGGGAEAPAAGSAAGRRTRTGNPLTSRAAVNPHLRSDPRLMVWASRTGIALAVYLGFMLWHGWRLGLTAAAAYFAADVIFRSKTATVIPASVRVTSAQRFTRRRLKVLHPSGYVSLNARTIPGTKSVIDHLVVGPAGIFALDSERLDKRIPLRALGGMLYHGQRSLEPRLDHARFEASTAAKLIGAELGQRVRVRPAMVTYGPTSVWVILPVKGVDVFDGSRVGTYFRRQSKATRGRHLDSDQISKILAAAARALPPLH
jgi:Nuclease-related domain